MVDFLHLIIEGWPSLAKGLVFLGATAWVLLADFESRVHRALALLLFLEGLEKGLFVFMQAPGDYFYRIATYVIFAIPFAAVNFAFVYHEYYGARPPRRPRSYTALRVFLLLVGLSFGFALAQNPRLFYAGGAALGPLYFFGGLPNLVSGVLALVFAREFHLAHLAIVRRGLGLVALGFSLNPLFGSSFYIVRTIPSVGGFGPQVPPDLYPEIGALACALAAGLLLLRARRRRKPDPLGEAWWQGPIMVAAAVSGALVGWWGNYVGDALFGTWVLLLNLLDLLWEGAAPVALLYAVLRYRFLGADVGAKLAIRGTTVGALLLSVFFVLSETPQALAAAGVLGVDSNLGTYVGLAAAGVLVFFLHPLARLGDRIADRALPTARPLREMPSTERAELYREQALLAWRDGVLNRKERLFLDQLRRQLAMPVALAVDIEGEALRSLKLDPRESGARPRTARAWRR